MQTSGIGRENSLYSYIWMPEKWRNDFPAASAGRQREQIIYTKLSGSCQIGQISRCLFYIKAECPPVYRCSRGIFPSCHNESVKDCKSRQRYTVPF